MANLFVRQDPCELTGKVVSVIPPMISPQAPAPISKWILIVKPDKPHQALLTTRNGNANPDGNIACIVGVAENVVNTGELLPLLSNAYTRRVRLIGTWCDDDDSATTVILPLGLLAVEYDIEVYDINGWPVAVRDYDLFAFSHSADFLIAGDDPHAGESRTLTVRLPFPFVPSGFAIPFMRVYQSEIVDRSDGTIFTIQSVEDAFELETIIVTGTADDQKGFFAAQIGLTFNEPELDDYCPPGTCDLDGKHCDHDGRFRFTRVPPHLPYAKKGDLALSPGDGHGFISGIVASLEPTQVYDHMGIFVDNGWTIRHCTSSMDRLEDEKLFTDEISIKLAGVIELENQKAPLSGLRPDLVRFGWPGSITQTVEQVYRNGRNTLNLLWTYATQHPGEDTEDPENPGAPFRIYHLPRAKRQRRLQFNDPERDKGESIVRLQDQAVKLGSPEKSFPPLLVRPHPQFDSDVRPALELVAEIAKKIRAHYRFFAYSSGSIGLDPKFKSPATNDPSWDGLAAGARWSAGTIPAMCSSFVWTAVQIANQNRPPSMFPIVLEDKADPVNPATGLEYGERDGFYQYHVKERSDTGQKLVSKIGKKIRDKFDSKIPAVAYGLLPQLLLFREMAAMNVANQIANTFAFDAAEALDESWSTPGEGETVSPDDTLNFWDLKEHLGVLFQPEGRQSIYGSSVQIILTPAQWKNIPLYRKRGTDLGTGKVKGTAYVKGVATEGVTVRFDFGCAVTTTVNNPEGVFNAVLGASTHFVDAFIVLPNPLTNNLETFRTRRPKQFDVHQGQTTGPIDLHLEAPSDLWRIVDIHLDADIHDKSFWGGDADAKEFHIDKSFELRQDLEDIAGTPEDQRNSILHHEEAWRTEPEVGSGVHIAVAIVADFDPSDRSVRCHCDVALIDTDSGGFLGIGSSSNVDQLETRDITIPPDAKKDVLKDFDFSSDETVPERARVTLTITNRRRPG